MFFLSDAVTFSEFSDSFHAIATAIFVFFLIIVIFWNPISFFNLIMHFEDVIEKREFFSRINSWEQLVFLELNS